MQRYLFLLFIFLGAFSVSGNPAAFSYPENALGDADPYGYLRIWREIDEVDFGGGLKLPLRIQFSSGREIASPYIGQGWWIPLIESRAYLKRPKMMEAKLLCGKTLFLRRSNIDSSKFYTLDKVWTGILTGDAFTMVRKDGFQLSYHQGHLSELRTDTGRSIIWRRDGNNKVLGLGEKGVESRPFEVSYNSAGEAVGFIVNGRRHTFETDKKPRVGEIAGQMMIQNLDSSLSAWKFPDGTVERYQFAADTTTLTPNLTVTDKGNVETTYTWDAKSKRILTGGTWKYEIGETKNALDVPTLRRINPQGQDEFIAVNTKGGWTEKKTLSGDHTFTYLYKSVGPLYDKIHKIEKIENGISNIIYDISYDELGRVVRKMDERGSIVSYTYGRNGEISSRNFIPTRRPEVLSELSKKEGMLLTALAAAPPESRVKELQKLARFYFFEAMDKKKGSEVLIQLGHKASFAIRVQAIDGDRELSPAQKVNAYKILLAQYPEYKNLLDWSIATRSEEAKNESAKK